MKRVNRDSRLKRKMSSKRTPSGRESSPSYIREHNAFMRSKANDFLQRMVCEPTQAEEVFSRLLKALGVYFIPQYPIFIRRDTGLIERFYIADFYLPGKDLVVEIDGGYHSKDLQCRYDSFRTEDIRSHYPNMRVLRIDNAKVLDPGGLYEFARDLLSI